MSGVLCPLGHQAIRQGGMFHACWLVCLLIRLLEKFLMNVHETLGRGRPWYKEEQLIRSWWWYVFESKSIFYSCPFAIQNSTTLLLFARCQCYNGYDFDDELISILCTCVTLQKNIPWQKFELCECFQLNKAITLVCRGTWVISKVRNISYSTSTAFLLYNFRSLSDLSFWVYYSNEQTVFVCMMKVKGYSDYMEN